MTNGGTVLFQNAYPHNALAPVGIARSTDGGGSWELSYPPADKPVPLLPIEQGLGYDKQTGRVFWLSIPEPGNYPTYVHRSDDDGKTWATEVVHVSEDGGKTSVADVPRIFVGPPPPEFASRLNGYPNIVYLFTTGPFGFRSFDGGVTFEERPLIIPTPDGEIGVLHSHMMATRNVFPTPGVVRADGTVYVGTLFCGHPYVAISKDAGETWKTVKVADMMGIGLGELFVALDASGTLSAAWIGEDDRMPYLALSRDGGENWSKPLMVGAPGLRESAYLSLAAGERGHVVVSYMGSKNSPRPTPPDAGLGHLEWPFDDNDVMNLFRKGVSAPSEEYADTTWDSYLTECWNILDEEPLLWSATVNDPAWPTWRGPSPETYFDNSGGLIFGAPSDWRQTDPATSLGHVLDYLSVTIGPDGGSWAAFVQQCPDGLPGGPGCPCTLTGTKNDSLIGLLGRLVRLND